MCLLICELGVYGFFLIDNGLIMVFANQAYLGISVYFNGHMLGIIW